MSLAVESQNNDSFVQQMEDCRAISKMKRCFCQNGFAGQQRLGQLISNGAGPIVMLVIAAHKGDKEPRVCDADHERENPFRLDKSRRRPRMIPPRRIYGFWVLDAFACSNCWRTIWPWGTPVRAAVSSSHAANSLLRRIVSV